MSFDQTRVPDPINYFAAQDMQLIGSAAAAWKTTACRFHGGSDSLRVNTHSGGWICMACGAKGGDMLAYHMQAHGLAFIEAARQLGAWTEDGRSAAAQKPAPLPPRAALEVLAFEATLTALAAGNIAKGVCLAETDRARLMVAARRISLIAEAYA
jgi:hypothetical protein